MYRYLIQADKKLVLNYRKLITVYLNNADFNSVDIFDIVEELSDEEGKLLNALMEDFIDFSLTNKQSNLWIIMRLFHYLGKTTEEGENETQKEFNLPSIDCVEVLEIMFFFSNSDPEYDYDPEDNPDYDSED